MNSSGREPSMEEILASIKKVIADDKELRMPQSGSDRRKSDEEQDRSDDEVLELNEPLAPEDVDIGPPLLEEPAADVSRNRFDELKTVAATTPPPAPPVNPLEDMVRELLRPILKQWLDDHLPGIVDEHVKREISRITGKPL